MNEPTNTSKVTTVPDRLDRHNQRLEAHKDRLDRHEQRFERIDDIIRRIHDAITRLERSKTDPYETEIADAIAFNDRKLKSWTTPAQAKPAGSPSPQAIAIIRTLKRHGQLAYVPDAAALDLMARLIDPLLTPGYGQAHSGPRDGGVE